jgi:hypothetical protein
MKNLLAAIGSWHTQWLLTGASPFIHSELYRHRLPPCIITARKVMLNYLRRTPANAREVFGRIELHATSLLSDITSYFPPGHASSELDTHAHLARVHALSLYQMLLLCSPYPRYRHAAESRIPILQAWLDTLLVHAARTIPYGCQSLLHPDHHSTTSTPPNDPRAPQWSLTGPALWHAWILAESVRRTYITGISIQSTYIMIRDCTNCMAIPGTCRGAVPFTTRRGAWEARSASSWEDLAVKMDFGLLGVEELEMGALKGWSEDELDDFTKVIVGASFGGLR